MLGPRLELTTFNDTIREEPVTTSPSTSSDMYKIIISKITRWKLHSCCTIYTSLQRQCQVNMLRKNYEQLTQAFWSLSCRRMNPWWCSYTVQWWSSHYFSTIPKLGTARKRKQQNADHRLGHQNRYFHINDYTSESQFRVDMNINP